MKLSLSVDEATKILKLHFAEKLDLGLSQLEISIGNTNEELKRDCLKNCHDLLDALHKINAIKYIRAVSGLGLADSKALIDAMERGTSDDVLIEKFTIANVKEI